jgi:tetratricopeptide (TPR) repeat protein
MGLRRGISLVLIAVVASSCAYYNIYWMARQEYGEALRESDESEFWDPTEARKLQGESLRLIDSCMKRCGKLLLLYPESGWVDDALLLMGNCFVLKGQYDDALKKYDELLSLYGSSEFAERAEYMKAYTLILYGSPQQATGLLEDLLEEAEDRDVRERSTYLLGAVLYNRGDCENAIPHLEVYTKRFPEGRMATNVRLNLGRCLIRLDRQEEAIDFLAPLAERVDVDGNLAAIQIGRARRELGQIEEAKTIFENLSQKAGNDSLRARAEMENAETLILQGAPEEAIEDLTIADSLSKRTPDLQSEIIYNIGLVYEKHLDDFERAIASYERAGKSKSKHGGLASKRAQALKAISKYESSLSDSTEDEAENRFLLAETYLMDLGLVDRAVREYRVVAERFPASEFGARSMLTLASLLGAHRDSLAQSYYRKVLELFPDRVFGNVARFHLGLPLTDVSVDVADTEAREFIGPPLVAPEDTSGTSAAGSPPEEIPGPPLPGDLTISRKPEFRQPASADRDTAGTEEPETGVGPRPQPEPPDTVTSQKPDKESRGLGPEPAPDDTLGPQDTEPEDQ